VQKRENAPLKKEEDEKCNKQICIFLLIILSTVRASFEVLVCL
jgi:hypothetical protein